ncbi:glycosyl transferase family 2 [Desulfonatronospira thiodismutans ASO3-1]|uniref:Glycosyl transferase family 2 n=1 Tax=Desulfonatronospira thiodismutans ASO3-1 TaxID=555779 RepID=D6SKU6_9BACT|nr:glycosyltransferase family A protein [Desulfonatronospira thiodismutans]EFI35307.1 glycosyl transferase family 2 [Desulfonatronospira thiodismutans ASO3-1]
MKKDLKDIMLEGKSKTPLKVSVIIPVYNDSYRLEACLRALSVQSYPKHLYEVVVVDNGSNDLPEKVADCYKGVILTKEERPGSYQARNRGIHLAQGEILAFTDSDCIPDKDWISAGVACLVEAEKTGIVGGSIQFFFNDNLNPSVPELYDSITYLQQKDAITLKKFAATANMFTWKEVMRHAGLFDVTLKSGGDREWGQRASALGYYLAYAPEAVVLHPARKSFSQIYKRNIRINGGHHQLRKRLREGKSDITVLLSELARDLCPPVRFGFRIINDERVPGLRNKLLVTCFHMLIKMGNAGARVSHQMGREPSRA